MYLISMLEDNRIEDTIFEEDEDEVELGGSRSTISSTVTSNSTSTKSPSEDLVGIHHFNIKRECCSLFALMHKYISKSFLSSEFSQSEEVKS